MFQICQSQDFGEEQWQATTDVPPVPKRGGVNGPAAVTKAFGLFGDFGHVLDARYRWARWKIRSAIAWGIRLVENDE